MSFLELVTDQLNLRWAWEKVRRASMPGDAWIDEIELGKFEVELERNLKSIAAEIQKGRYRLRSIRPMAFPKNSKKDGTPQVRQYFNVAVRDQVAWTAVVNVIGPLLDPHMPAWSYGNRLFRSIWVETDEDGRHHRKIGRYRHSSGRIYLPFGQSWPIFRRHVFLATSAMTAIERASSSSQLTKGDTDELDLQERLKEEHRCPFVSKEYWAERQPAEGKENLFWCSIDLEKFYPSLKLDRILSNIVEFLPDDIKTEATKLIESMMRFQVDTQIDRWEVGELPKICLKDRQRTFKAIPTGLYVAGFLANVGLLKVDQKVVELLSTRDIAHFRYVDDHIILAYTFDDLVKWIDEYLSLLADSKTGAKVNYDKMEPEALAKFYSSRKNSNSRKRVSEDHDIAVKACKLNPQFPSPLMTKTIALVSAIARTDLDLLEESELVSLTDQLEHMLLVELPETEIPEKTRLSFAATKLMHLAECRLSNNARLTELDCRLQGLVAKLADKEISPELRESLKVKKNEILNSLNSQHSKINREVGRAFGLLRKVLQERPDRVRLWARAVQMCRQTGVAGLKDIFKDIDRVKSELNNSLAAEYILANTLTLLGYEVVIAARLIVDPDGAEWRRKAAHAFLTDISSTGISKPLDAESRWFLQKSWKQFCFGLYCADLITKSSSSFESDFRFEMPAELIAIGAQCLTSEEDKEHRLGLAWWAARLSLRELSSHSPSWVVTVGRQMHSIGESSAFWRFFPFDVPDDTLLEMHNNKKHSGTMLKMSGWWYDALSKKPEIGPKLLANGCSAEIANAVRNLQSTSNDRFVPLHEWAAKIRDICARDGSDPRASEWTSLEIVRQIGMSITESNIFNLNYILKQKVNRSCPLCLHPANFRVPREWLELPSPTWNEWQHTIQPGETRVLVKKVNKDQHLTDSRYTPVWNQANMLFDSVNSVRGLGLLLYGLLRHDFGLPTVWNGPGHADVLALLPRLLLKDMTYSSLTLGLLQACLQPRAMENLIFSNRHLNGEFLDDDSLHDPFQLLSAQGVCLAIEKCQAILKENQLSTINHRARQLTPISIRLLTRPDWTKEFGD